MKNVFEWRTITGATIVVGELEVTLEARTLAVRLPVGGLAWTRPSAVIVRRGSKVEKIPIHDVTRIINSAMLACTPALALAFTVFGLTAKSRRVKTPGKEQHNG